MGAKVVKNASMIKKTKKAKKDENEEEDNSIVEVKSVTMMRKPPTKAKGKVIAVGNNKSAKNFGVIEDLNEPGSLFDSTPGGMVMKIKSGVGGVESGGDEDDGGGEKKKRLGSKRRKGMLSKRERRRKKLMKNAAGGEGGNVEEEEEEEEVSLADVSERDNVHVSEKSSLEEKKDRRKQE